MSPKESPSPADAEVGLASLPMAHRDYARQADLPVERTPVLMECAAVRNGNPLFWDTAVADQVAGGPVTPPTMLSTWCRPHLWSPAGNGNEPMPMQIHFDLKAHFDLPAAVVADYVMTLHEPISVGDMISSRQRLVSVGPTKQTRLGRGRFWAFDVDYHNQHGDLVGVENWTMFAYQPTGSIDEAEG